MCHHAQLQMGRGWQFLCDTWTQLYLKSIRAFSVT